MASWGKSLPLTKLASPSVKCKVQPHLGSACYMPPIFQVL